MWSCLTPDPDSEASGDFIQFGNRDEDGKSRRRRQCTDVFFLYFFGAFVALSLAFFIYCASIGNINRILNGYDNCGNVCGEQNKRIGDEVGCTGLDMTTKPYLLEIDLERKCVASCSEYGYNTIFGRCVPKPGSDAVTTRRHPFWQKILEDITACQNEIIYMAFISFALTGLSVMLLRYNTEGFIWANLIGGAVALVLITIGVWVCYARTKVRYNKQVFLSIGIMVTVLTIVLLLCLLVMFKRIKMVVALFKEASKAIGSIPHLLLEPIVTIAAFGVSVVVLVYGGMLIGSAGNLKMITEKSYEYVPNNAVIFTGVIFVVGWIWMLYFFKGCQDMIVAGSISSWYFIRDKSRLSSPILYSTYNLVRYHLGTVAFGSLIMLIMRLIRMIIESLKRAARRHGCGICLLCCSCIFDVIEEFARYFSRLAFIVSAMHGVQFCQGGKAAMRLLVNNGMSTIAFNSVGSFILFFMNMTIMLATILIAYFMMDKVGLNSPWHPVAACTLIACFMAHCVFTVYDTALDTIFLCFCEDSEINDGLSRPYYMSADLMLFVENSKKALEQLEAEKEAKAAKKRGEQQSRAAWNATSPAVST